MALYRESNQRKAVMSNLSQRCDHPAAAQIYEDLRKRIPNLSLGTVYRNLEILEDQNRIRSIKLDQRETRYDAAMNPHAHFYCKACGAVVDMPLREDCCQIAQDLRTAGNKIEKVCIDIIGLCGTCLQRH
jgi:Fe2+ or Zn2+ uptake regulation protein